MSAPPERFGWCVSDWDQWVEEDVFADFDTPCVTQIDWTITDWDQWIADLECGDFFGPCTAPVVPTPTRHTGERIQREPEKFDHISDENDILELVALIILMVEP
jgi:hypothetical protein